MTPNLGEQLDPHSKLDNKLLTRHSMVNSVWHWFLWLTVLCSGYYYIRMLAQESVLLWDEQPQHARLLIWRFWRSFIVGFQLFQKNEARFFFNINFPPINKGWIVVVSHLSEPILYKWHNLSFQYLCLQGILLAH